MRFEIFFARTSCMSKEYAIGRRLTEHKLLRTDSDGSDHMSEPAMTKDAGFRGCPKMVGLTNDDDSRMYKTDCLTEHFSLRIALSV